MLASTVPYRRLKVRADRHLRDTRTVRDTVLMSRTEDHAMTHVCTSGLRFSDDRSYVALRRALHSAGFDPNEVVVADFHPEGKALVDHVEFEWMWVTMVSASSGAAFLGDLMINDHTELFRRLREVPARPIPESVALAQQFNDNRRRQVPWKTDLPEWVSSPDDFLYNTSIQEAVAYIALDQAQE